MLHENPRDIILSDDHVPMDETRSMSEYMYYFIVHDFMLMYKLLEL